MVPTTAGRFGWRCKLCSIFLEIFQLGTLAPAAIFEHEACLFYLAPLGAGLEFVSWLVAAFGYVVWGFVGLSFPVIVIYVCLLGGWAATHKNTGSSSSVVGPPASAGGKAAARGQTTATVTEASATVIEADAAGDVDAGDHCCRCLAPALDACPKLGPTRSVVDLFWGGFTVAMLPVALGATILAVLVVVGQFAKGSALQRMAGFVLLSDILVKVGATLILEVGDYLLHLRVVRAVRERRRAKLRGGSAGGPRAGDDPEEPLEGRDTSGGKGSGGGKEGLLGAKDEGASAGGFDLDTQEPSSLGRGRNGSMETAASSSVVVFQEAEKPPLPPDWRGGGTDHV